MITFTRNSFRWTGILSGVIAALVPLILTKSKTVDILGPDDWALILFTAGLISWGLIEAIFSTISDYLGEIKEICIKPITVKNKVEIGYRHANTSPNDNSIAISVEGSVWKQVGNLFCYKHTFHLLPLVSVPKTFEAKDLLDTDDSAIKSLRLDCECLSLKLANDEGEVKRKIIYTPAIVYNDGQVSDVELKEKIKATIKISKQVNYRNSMINFLRSSTDIDMIKARLKQYLAKR